MYKGTIVENSLQDPSLLKSLNIDKTWQDGDWTLHDVLVDKETALTISKHLADGPWYIHFWEPGNDDVLVVFKERNFWIKHSEKSSWVDAIAYGTSIGIPEDQLDFIIT